MSKEEPYAFCSESGRNYLLRDLFDSNGCKKKGDKYLCDCHTMPLVEDYPFVITIPKMSL